MELCLLLGAGQSEITGITSRKYYFPFRIYSVTLKFLLVILEQKFFLSGNHSEKTSYSVTVNLNKPWEHYENVMELLYTLCQGVILKKTVIPSRKYCIPLCQPEYTVRTWRKHHGIVKPRVRVSLWKKNNYSRHGSIPICQPEQTVITLQNRHGIMPCGTLRK
jgi:hypothetical protein